MEVTTVLDEVKLVIKFVKGSQTIGHCNKSATDENLYKCGQAIASLNRETVSGITKVVETTLLEK